MRSPPFDRLRCPICRGMLGARGDDVQCVACARTYPLHAGRLQLLSAPDALQPTIAALDEQMRWYPKGTIKMSLAGLIYIPAERIRLLRALPIRPGETVLDHCTGPGANLPTLAQQVGPTGRLVGMDLSGAALDRAVARIRRRRLDVELHQADAFALPYADETFDAVVHYGAVSEFGARTRLAIDEMLRVTKRGGLVVLLDEGLEPHRRGGWWGRLLIWGSAVFAAHPPLDALPQGIACEVRWVMRGMFYEMRFRKP